MDSSRKRQPIILQATDFAMLKTEIEFHLNRLTRRDAPEITFISHKIPMGFGDLINAEHSFSTTIPFPIAGRITDVISFGIGEVKEVEIKVTARTPAGIEEKLYTASEGFKEYSLLVDVPRLSFLTFTITNKGKEPVEIYIGLTFEERFRDEIKTLGFVKPL